MSNADIFTETDRERLLSVLKERKPRSAWLFGSRARSISRPDSDVDLLIVDERAGGSEGIEIDISMDLFPRFWHLDILAFKPEDLERERRDPDSFISRVLESAELLYEQD